MLPPDHSHPSRANQINKPGVVSLAYPSNYVIKQLAHLPMLLWRLGLGFLFDGIILIMTTTGRKSGLPRRTALEFHQYQGRKYIYSGWGKRAHWYQNILADPHVTLQSRTGTERVSARRLEDERELAEAVAFYMGDPVARWWFRALSLPLNPADILAHQERLYLLTFDPTSAPTPPPVAADLKWAWAVTLASGLIGWLVGRRGRQELIRKYGKD